MIFDVAWARAELVQYPNIRIKQKKRQIEISWIHILTYFYVYKHLGKRTISTSSSVPIAEEKLAKNTLKWQKSAQIVLEVSKENARNLEIVLKTCQKFKIILRKYAYFT